MARYQQILLATVALVALTSGEVLNKVLFDPSVKADYSASCLDGSPAGYYLSAHPNSTGWVIYLQGGGLCVTRIDCENRLSGNLGSSNHWGPTHDDTTNVLGGVQDGNPFGTFNKVWIPYCSGDTWTGTTTSNPHLHGLPTTGHNIIEAVVDHLINTSGFDKATHVLLSGGSAGGIGVFHNADWLSDTVKTSVNPNAVVKASPQAGYFFPENVTLFEEFAVGIRIPFDKLASDYVHWLEGGFMNQACAAALGEKKSLCWDISVVQKYLKTPLFVAQNQIDAQQVTDELGCLSACSTDPKLELARKFMMDYKSLLVPSLQKFVADGPDRVAWSPSCFNHCENLCMNMQNSPATIDGVSYGAGLGAWFFNGTHSGSAFIQSCPPDDLLCTPNCGHGCQDC